MSQPPSATARPAAKPKWTITLCRMVLSPSLSLSGVESAQCRRRIRGAHERLPYEHRVDARRAQAGHVTGVADPRLGDEQPARRDAGPQPDHQLAVDGKRAQVAV